jgi:tetratricopeptide (TPR) repeat protein
VLTESDRYVLAGRLLNYLGEIDASIAMFGEGIAMFPDDARLYRHRGHRYLTARQPEAAVQDLIVASELIEGTSDEHEFFQPRTQQDLVALVLGRELPRQRLPLNQETIEATRGEYKSTLHVSVYYHLGIGYYLLARFADALEAFERCADLSIDDDMRVAAADWSYTALRRLGRHEDALAAAHAFDVDGSRVNPGEDYYLQRLRMYRGEIDPDALLARHQENPLAFATQGYAVGVHHLTSDRADDARAIFAAVAERGAFGAFGRIAAEADLARL